VHPRDLLDLTGRAVLVTGASGGIGAGIAARFAEAGAAVAVHYRTDAEGARAVLDRIRHGVMIQADVSQPDDVERLIGHAAEALGRLDVLVNNAGRQPLVALLDMTVEEWDDVLDANARGVFLCTQAAARWMIGQGATGAIVNVASIEAENPAPLHSHYNASKAAVLMHTRAAANELGRYGIRVNAVSPGLIWREGLAEQWPEGVSRWQAAAPLQRLGRPEDVADACLFLASDAARWITGANLRVDGGMLTGRGW
jgi:NAD(P)-dependent dehydrogenase (short-subunit alcohol dehydrogenase family)